MGARCPVTSHCRQTLGLRVRAPGVSRLMRSSAVLTEPEPLQPNLRITEDSPGQGGLAVTKRRLLVCLVSSLTLILVVFAGPALAVNDPFTPGDDCAASEEAVGHPAAANEQSDQASPPFSSNNPGESEGAQGSSSQATAHCHNAQP